MKKSLPSAFFPSCANMTSSSSSVVLAPRHCIRSSRVTMPSESRSIIWKTLRTVSSSRFWSFCEPPSVAARNSLYPSSPFLAKSSVSKSDLSACELSSG
jgi:hypothetical protein